MLFRASITPDIIEAEDLLIKQLYIFLEDFVPRRLKYESKEEIEDCIQETMLYLIKRFKKLGNKSISQTTLEKFFYNRANSFVTGHLNKLKAFRSAEAKVINNKIYEILLPEEPEEYIEHAILEDIIDSYNLGKHGSMILMSIAKKRLLELGYVVGSINEIKDINRDSLKAYIDISYSVVDEYLVKSVQE